MGKGLVHRVVLVLLVVIATCECGRILRKGPNRTLKSRQHQKLLKAAEAVESEEVEDRVKFHPVEKWLEAAEKNPDFNRRYSKGISGRAEWFQNGQDALQEALRKQELNQNVAKNVIIFIGDGMGISTATAARIFEGNEREDDAPGEQNLLSFEKFPFTGLSKTYNADWQVPDSAGSATAILCGIKSRFNMVAMDESAIQFLCSTQDGAEVDSILYWAEDAGKSTGVVTNTGITHGTPAAAYANSVSRNYESDKDIIFPSQNCTDIAVQLIQKGHDIEVAMGGARSKFFPEEEEDPAEPGSYGVRKDGRNLIEEWKADKIAKDKTHEVVYTTEELEEINTADTDYLFGLFSRGHMSYHRERSDTQPSLSVMTKKAIEVLQKNDNGFFLMVEGGRIDAAHHGSRLKRALTETVEFSESVQMAVDMTNEEDTLVIVTADHSHVLTLAGYHAKGSDILGKGIYPAEDLMPYTKLSYANGPGYDINSTTCRRGNLLNVDTSDNDFVAQSSARLGSETHGGEDVGIYARGPMAHLLQGVQEQHFIAHAAAYAACIGTNTDHCSGRQKPEKSTKEFHSTATCAMPHTLFVFILLLVANCL